MSAKKILEFILRQKVEGDDLSKVVGEINKTTDGLTDMEKAMVGARSTIGGLDRDIHLFGNNLGSAADMLGAFGVAIPQSPMALFGQLLKEGIDLIWETTQMAGDAAEQASLFQQTFRGETQATRLELEAYGDEVGRSTIELMDMASGIQTILTPMGMAREEAADWSVELAQLATDLGAAFNKADADVLADIRSGLLGSTEVMEKYGVNLKMAAINQELLNMGIEGGVQQASELEKVQARLNLLLKQTGDYQGQAARESEGFNGQMKALEATIYDLKIILGEEYIPTATEAIKQTNELLQGVMKQKNVNEVTQSSWDLLEQAQKKGQITQKEFNDEIERMHELMSRGDLEGMEDQYEELYNDLVLSEDAVEFINNDLGYYADIAERAGKSTGDLSEETGELSEELNGASVEARSFSEELEKITSLDANFSGMVRLAVKYDDILEDINDKQRRIKQLMEIRQSGGYLDGVYVSAQDARDEIAELNGEIGDLQSTMEEMANQVVLDMLMATIAIDGVTEAEAAAYFQMAADMEMISQDAADAAIEAYGNAIDKINNMNIHPKTGQITMNVRYNDPGWSPNTGGGGTYQQGGGNFKPGDTVAHEFQADGGYVPAGQPMIVGELGPERVVLDQPAQVISNRDMQKGEGLGGMQLQFYGPTYFRNEQETRALIERVLMEAARG